MKTKTKIPKLSSLIESKKFDWVNQNIKERLFDVPKKISSDYRLFNFDRYVSSDDAIDAMLHDGYKPANIYELLLWKDWNEKDWVVALGSVGEVDGDRSVPCLDKDGSRRYLNLYWFGLDWDARCRFLAIKVGSKDSKVIESKYEECKHKINYCPDCGEKIS